MSAHQPNTSPSAPPRDPLPVELLTNIITRLAIPQLADVRASRLLYAIATPHLYKSVYSVMPKRGTLSPYLADMLVGGYPYPAPLRGTITSIPVGDLVSSLSSQTTPSPLVSFPRSFHFKTHLTISAHPSDDCHSLQSLTMPNLQTLRILPGLLDHRLMLCYYTSLADYYPPASQCPLISQLRPRRLIMGGMTGSLAGTARGLDWPLISASPLEHVRELVIHVGILAGWGDTSYTTFLADLPHKVKKVTFVLPCTEKVVWSKDGRQLCNKYKVCMTWAWMVLPIVMADRARVVELANYEQVAECWMEQKMGDDADDLDGRDYKEYLKSGVKHRLGFQGWDEAEAEEAAESIRFIGAEEWNGRAGML